MYTAICAPVGSFCDDTNVLVDKTKFEGVRRGLLQETAHVSMLSCSGVESVRSQEKKRKNSQQSCDSAIRPNTLKGMNRVKSLATTGLSGATCEGSTYNKCHEKINKNMTGHIYASVYQEPTA